MTDLPTLLSRATKWPWRISSYKAKSRGSVIAKISGQAFSWTDLCRVWVRVEDSDEDSPEGVANAALIALAPQLAAALIEAREALRLALDDLDEWVSCTGSTTATVRDDERTRPETPTVEPEPKPDDEPDSATDPEGYDRWKEKQEADQ